MASKEENKTDINIGDICLLLSSGTEEMVIFAIFIGFIMLIRPISKFLKIVYNAIASLFLVLKKNRIEINPKISFNKSTIDIKPETMRFHFAGKKKLITIFIIDSLLITVFYLVLHIGHFPFNKFLEIFGLWLFAIIGITCLSMITCDMHAVLSCDGQNLYIGYDYLLSKKMMKVIPLKNIKKIIFTEDKIIIKTKFHRTSLMAEEDSEAYAYLLNLKQKLNV